jgi:peptidoglycan/xylan/chitin deacetylase (PgdA/CDA1 family)
MRSKAPLIQKVQIRTNPLITFSAVLHIGACAAVFWQVWLWPWALGVVIADHLLLVGCGLLPRSRTLGANLSRLPDAAAARGEIALTIDDGPDPLVTPQVLDLLDHFAAKASFFCVGTAAQGHPDLCREIMRRGHSIENHTQHHRYNFSLSGPRSLHREIAWAQSTLTNITGHKPHFFRAPAGLRNLFLDTVLIRLNLRLVSWTRRGYDTINRDPEKVLKLLLHNLRAGDILVLHDGNAALTRNGVPVILEILPLLLASVRGAGLHCVTLRAAMEAVVDVPAAPVPEPDFPLPHLIPAARGATL